MSDLHDEYVPGDVNTLDDDELDVDDADDVDVDDLDDAPGERAVTATAVLEYIAKSLADEPDAVELEVTERSGKVIFSLSVGPSDMGRIIGRRGRTAQAIRVLVGAAGVRDGVTTSVDIVD
ncbi:MAG: KH domain-containing protein [Acidimicrobiales bacterium]